ncbi:MAG: SDR family oxidoreductase [Acidiferrobacterales bacterium]|nr:SDR family oxidoreductase [Acidiferrobacterales bacterium]
MLANIQQLFDLRGRVALCTGGSSGIGRRMALALSQAGAEVVLVGRNKAALVEAIEQIEAEGGGSGVPLAADLLDRSTLGDVVAEASKAFGAPDILINAAGINLREPWNEISEDSWQQTLDINLSTPFFLARHCIEGMKTKGQGNIINVASLQSYRAFANSMAYGASKGGIAQLTRAMAEAWSPLGIVSNAVAPGFFPTELTRKVYENPELLAHNAGMTAIGRNGELSDLDGVTVFLASAAASYITGQIISVDGGFTAK